MARADARDRTDGAVSNQERRGIRRKQAMKDMADFARGNASFPSDLRTAGVRVVRFLDEDRKGFWNSLDDYTLMAVESSPALTVASMSYGAGRATTRSERRNYCMSRGKREGVPVKVFDNSGSIGSHVEKDIEFLRLNSYIESHERQRNVSTGEAAAEIHRGDERDGLGRDGRGGKTDAGASREGAGGGSGKTAAVDRLVSEGKVILDRYRREGKLTDEDVEAFLR
jgi:hypothetical protein